MRVLLDERLLAVNFGVMTSNWTALQFTFVVPSASFYLQLGTTNPNAVVNPNATTLVDNFALCSDTVALCSSGSRFVACTCLLCTGGASYSCGESDATRQALDR